MEPKHCPQCRRFTVQNATKPDGSEEARCQTCGWDGPKCFGRLHDETNVKCKGGADPTYWDAGHVREKCSFFDKCKEAQQVTTPRQEQTVFGMMSTTPPPNRVGPPVLPPVTAPRIPPPPTPTAAPPRPPAITPVASMPQQPSYQQVSLQQGLQIAAQQQQAAQAQQAAQQAAYAQPRLPLAYGHPVPSYGYGQPNVNYSGMMVPPEQAMMPALVPQNHLQPGMQVPSYLTVPEPYKGKLVPMLFNSMFRAAFKGMFHTAANLMDHFPWGE